MRGNNGKPFKDSYFGIECYHFNAAWGGTKSGMYFEPMIDFDNVSKIEADIIMGSNLNGLTNTTILGVQLNEITENDTFDVSETIIDKTSSGTEYNIVIDTSDIAGNGYIKLYLEHGTESNLYTVTTAIKNLKIYYKNDKPIFDVKYEQIEENKNKVMISNIRYRENIANWQVKYKQSGEENWQTSDNLTFNVDSRGMYDIKIVCKNIESKVKTVYIGDYIDLEYIQFTLGSYIDTGIIPSNHTSEVKFDFEEYSDDEFLLGTESNLNNNYHFTTYQNKYYWGLNGSQESNGTWSTGIHTLIYNGENNEVILDEETLGSGSSIVGTTNLRIGYRLYAGATFQGKIYYVKVTDKSTGNLVRDFIPVHNRVTNSAGLYDKIEKKFYPNNGTGSFIEGNTIN